MTKLMSRRKLFKYVERVFYNVLLLDDVIKNLNADIKIIGFELKNGKIRAYISIDGVIYPVDL